jgi:hypothetical protein
MHEWAVTVERLSGRINEDLKSGSGPQELLSLFRAISEAMAIGKAAASYLRRTRRRSSGSARLRYPICRGGAKDDQALPARIRPREG